MIRGYAAKYRAELAVFAAALGLRALFLFQWSRTPYWLTPQVDDLVHHQWALEILRDGLVRHAAFYQSPLYPYLLAGLYRVFGVRPELMLGLQALAGAAACVVLTRVGSRLFGARAGLLAGLLAAAYEPFLFHTGFLLKETVVVLSLALFLLAFLRARESGRFLDAALCGLALGVAALGRGNALFLLPAALGLGREPRRAAAFVLGFGLAVAPATVHNWLASRDFVLVNATTGFSAFIGNNPEATGTTHYPLGISSHPQVEEKEAAARAEVEAARPLKPSEVSRHWAKRALEYALEQPFSWLDLTARKFLLFWNWYELPDDYDINFVEREAPTLLSWPLLGFRWLGTLGILGAAWAFRRRPETRPLLALAALYAASVILTFVTDRYRLPFAVFLAPFAGAFLDRLLSSSRWEALAAASPALPLAALCQWPMLSYGPRDESQGWVGVMHARRDLGQHEYAVAAFVRAAQASERPLGEGAYLAAMDSALKLGDEKAAAEARAEGLRRMPESAVLKAVRVSSKKAPRR